MSQAPGLVMPHETQSSTNKHVSAQRRLQNRVAQREYRRRMREIGLAEKSKLIPEKSHEQTKTESVSPDISTSKDSSKAVSSPTPIVGATRLPTQQEGISDSNLKTRWIRHLVQKANLHKLSHTDFTKMLANFESVVLSDYLIGSPRTDQLLTLIQFNVFRALISNTYSMGFTMSWLEPDTISPWITDSTNDFSITKCPPCLQPTVLQSIIAHHPWIDLLPAPEIRDNLLLAAGNYDEDELCNDLVEFLDVPNEKSGFIVWGEPWDTAGWEVSETFLKNWAWVVRGCSTIEESTNQWRRKRNEEELDFEQYYKQRNMERSIISKISTCR